MSWTPKCQYSPIQCVCVEGWQMTIEPHQSLSLWFGSPKGPHESELMLIRMRSPEGPCSLIQYWYERDPLEVDVWRIAEEADIVNSTEVPSDECPGQRFSSSFTWWVGTLFSHIYMCWQCNFFTYHIGDSFLDSGQWPADVVKIKRSVHDIWDFKLASLGWGLHFEIHVALYDPKINIGYLPAYRTINQCIGWSAVLKVLTFCSQRC